MAKSTFLFFKKDTVFFNCSILAIPELIIKCLRGIPIETTKGTKTREFNYVKNIVDGLIKAMTTEPSIKNVVNIGSNTEISIKELTKSIHKLTKSKSDLRIGALPDRPTEIWRMSADNKKAKEILKSDYTKSPDLVCKISLKIHKNKQTVQ